MGRRKGEVNEIHRAGMEVEGEGASDPTEFAGVSEFVKGVVGETELVANGSQEGEGVISPEGRAAIEGADRLNVTVNPDGTTEAVPQVPTGNPTEREETKRMNFKRVAGGRVTRILEGLRLLKHCSNTATYEWDNTQHDKIFGAIHDLAMEVENAFVQAKKPRVRSGPRKQLRFEV